MKSIKVQLRKLLKTGACFELNEGMLTALSPRFLQGLDWIETRCVTEEEKLSVREKAVRAFGEAFSGVLSSKEVIEFLSSSLFERGGEFYEMAKWYLLVRSSKDLEYEDEVDFNGEELEIAYVDILVS